MKLRIKTHRQASSLTIEGVRDEQDEHVVFVFLQELLNKYLLRDKHSDSLVGEVSYKWKLYIFKATKTWIALHHLVLFLKIISEFLQGHL